ncbi:NAD(P)/FAD-dependent oxidoreductase [Pseudofrankia sp. BMG5.36]|uniref:flavin monoamine oxidase family protein n=1 Tax=Pseudofrankia sp. BMG5.36 TaxID=1834512 RepID=UPI0008DA7647|nr:NAD(P)/FAD-dependent oxidoreductase [Pseudofrankia sp. BMG5.36]OHV73977.1 hypothetical protein BCD48_32780 [Pseudofrankia sp. BMG5.36]
MTRGAAERADIADHTHADIVIIGAGTAGLAAAHALTQRGREVVVLEARGRIGGRVHTITDLADQPVELGAEWIHTSTTPIRRAIAEFGMADEEFPVSHGLDVIAIDDERWNSLLEAAADLDPSEDLRSFVDRLAGSVAERDELEKLFAFWTTRESLEETSALHTMLEVAGNRTDGEALHDADFKLKRGWRPVLDRLAAGVDIRLGVAVRSITWSDPVVQMNAVTDDGRAVTVSAEHVVVTVPLGVLQNNGIRFEPPLPARKREAIDSMSHVPVVKMVFVFDGDVWPDGAPDDISDPEILPSRAILSNGWQENRAQTIIALWAGGRDATRIESQDVPEVLRLGEKALEHYLGDKFRRPRKAIVHLWAGDPYARGAYSHTPPGARADVRDRLAEPLNGRLFWAGEATARWRPRTVGGAYASGLRVADELS